MIEFNVPPVVGTEEKYLQQAINNHKICGDGEFTKKCSKWMEKKFNARSVLLTTSCSSALEMSALLTDIKPDDEVIMPAYTFVSTANAFVLGTTTKYQVPKMLSDYGINSAPQSFQYWAPSESDAML